MDEAGDHAATVALIPARGGSKGLPGKNLATVEGATLVARAIQLAGSVRGIREAVVSSDSEDILAEARACSATPSLRPAHLATDSAPTLDVVREFVATRPEVDVVVILQPTSPLTATEDVQRCVDAVAGGATTAVTVTESDHPAAWLFGLTPDQRLDPPNGWEDLPTRRQDAAATVRLNGAVYVARAAHVAAGGALVGPDTVAITMPRERSVDIDDELDLVVARAVADWLRQRS